MVSYIGKSAESLVSTNKYSSSKETNICFKIQGQQNCLSNMIKLFKLFKRHLLKKAVKVIIAKLVKDTFVHFLKKVFNKKSITMYLFQCYWKMRTYPSDKMF